MRMCKKSRSILLGRLLPSNKLSFNEGMILDHPFTLSPCNKVRISMYYVIDVLVSNEAMIAALSVSLLKINVFLYQSGLSCLLYLVSYHQELTIMAAIG